MRNERNKRNLRGLALCFWVAVAGAGADAAEPKPPFTTTPLAGSVSVLQGFEYNIVVSAGDDGIVMVDALTEKTAVRLQAALFALSAKPLRFVINTHVHGDHTGGNAFFQKLAPVISSEHTRRWLASGNEVTRDKPGAPEALPAITFDGEMTLRLNGEEIRLVKLPPAHTGGDVVVFFKNANVVALGDVYIRRPLRSATVTTAAGCSHSLRHWNYCFRRFPPTRR